MNVLVFSGDITRGGGTEKAAAFLTSFLVSRSEAKVRTVSVVSLVSSNAQPVYSIDPRVKRYGLGAKSVKEAFGPKSILFMGRLYKLVKELQIDVIIDVDVVLDVLSIPVAQLLHVNVISWEHFNLAFEKQSLYRRFIVGLFTKHSQAVVTLTQSDAIAYKNKFPQKLVECIPNPMPLKQTIPEHISKNEKGLQIITIGRMEHQKGIDMLLPTAAKVLAKHSEVTWVYLGEGSLYRQMEEFISEHHLEERFRLLGFVRDVSSYLAESDIYVSTSRGEGLPMALLEAKAQHLPIISFDIQTGPSDLICDGINGYLVSPFNQKKMEECIETLLTDEGLRNDFSVNAMLGMERYDAKIIESSWLNLLEKMREN